MTITIMFCQISTVIVMQIVIDIIQKIDFALKIIVSVYEE